MSVALERFGDRWSLLLIRDMMVRGYKTFREFSRSGEGIATSVLANRLSRLRAAGIIAAEPDPGDHRKVVYRLTEKGIDLAPVMLDLLLWSTRWERTAAPNGVMEQMANHRAEVLREVRRRWRERDPEPFLPPFAAKAKAKGSRQALKGAKR